MFNFMVNCKTLVNAFMFLFNVELGYMLINFGECFYVFI